MPITIFFRGVGIYVRGSDTTVVEILFPNAEEGSPPNGEIGDDGLPRHADNTRSTSHFAGVLIPRPTGAEYRKLLGRRVQFPGSIPTVIGSDFPNHYPSLPEMTGGDGFGLTLLPEADREKPQGRVATRIKLFGGNLTWSTPASGLDFNIDGHHAKGHAASKKRRYSTAGVWTSDGEDPIQLDVSVFSASGKHQITELPIRLDVTAPVAYFYNFDNALPTEDDLRKDETDIRCKGRLTDHDFKWIYKLMDFANPPFKTWQEWLQGEEFPTPWTPCPAGGGNKVSTLLPVSTCFQTVL
jgi:hypothetical protein